MVSSFFKVAKAYSEIKEFADDCNNTGIEEIMEKLAQYALPDAETEKVNAINSAGVMFQGIPYLYGSTMILGPCPNGFIGGIPMFILALVIVLKSEKNFKKGVDKSK